MAKLRGKTVLVADDSQGMRTLLARLLGAFGAAKVVTATDGGEALDIFCRQPTDLVVTDLAMGPVDGLALTAALRAPDAPAPLVPVVMVTSHGEDGARQAAFAAGVDEFAVKPVVPGSFYTHVVTALDRRRPLIRSPQYCGPDRRLTDAAAQAAYDGPERRAPEGRRH